MKELIIEMPKIEKSLDKARLVAEIKVEEHEKYNLWFEVENEYEKYLCVETADAFLVALIPYFVKHDLNVKVNGKISSKLYYQLINYLFPLLRHGYKKHNLNIDCQITDMKYDSKGVGASISCGVDSFYTLFKHKNLPDSKYNITHLTFFNAGSHGEYGGEEARDLYHKRLKNIKSFCDENSYKLVTVDSNMNEFIMMSHLVTHTFRTLGCVLALQKLFGKYYFASGTNFDDTMITPISCAYYDILNVQCLSTENTQIYCSGIETTRIEKIKYISQFKETYNWLNVCIAHNDGNNCSKCEKCIRTMTALDSINKLQKYKNVFDLDYYHTHKLAIYSDIIRNSRDKEMKEYYLEIYNAFKQNNKKLPFRAYCLSIFPAKVKIKRIIKRILPQKLIRVYRIKKGIINDGFTD